MVSQFRRKRRRLFVKTKTDNGNGNGNGNGKSKPGNGNGNGKLTALRQRFVDEYIVDLNATQAVIRAGYSRKGAEVQGSYLLSLINIQEAVQKRRLVLQNKVQITQEGIIKRYLMLADYCIDDFFNDDGTMKLFSEIPKEKLYAIGGFKQSKKTLTDKDKVFVTDRIKEFKLPSKRLVLDSLGKHLGMFEADNKQKGFGQGNTIIGRNIQVNLVDDSGTIIS